MNNKTIPGTEDGMLHIRNIEPGDGSDARQHLHQLSHDLFLCETTCKTYVIRQGRTALLVDAGDGSVFDRLAGIGVDQVTDVLMTHHHRDQAQGLRRAVDAGARIWVPETEQDLFSRVDAHWQARPTADTYNVRQDRFSLLAPVPVGGLLRDYEVLHFGDLAIEVIPTPGHTIGSVSLLADIDGKRAAFTGDLIAGPGKVWSLAATQWTYNGAEGIPQTILSLTDLKDRSITRIYPSHGEVIEDVGGATDLLIERLTKLLAIRGEYAWLAEKMARPFRAITPHLLINLTSVADSYVLLSDSGNALVIDFGYDFSTGMPSGEDRASRRPWLRSLKALKEQFGVEKIEVAIPTHPHDDHVAGFNTLRRVEGTEIWAAEIAAPILENPTRYNLPCMWYDAIPVDRALPFSQPVRWQEYELTLHPLPGHSAYAAAIEFTADGKRFLATGDQYQSGEGTLLNYVYPNRFAHGDFISSAALIRKLSPDSLLTGHWGAQVLTEEYLRLLEERGAEFAQLHRDLLAEEIHGWGAESFGAHIEPYRVEAQPGECIEYSVEIANPCMQPAEAHMRVVKPEGWQTAPEEHRIKMDAAERRVVKFDLIVSPEAAPGLVPIAVEMDVDGKPYGQQAEALVNVGQQVSG